MLAMTLYAPRARLVPELRADPAPGPGQVIVGRVLACGPGVDRLKPGERVGVPWLGWTCGVCEWCRGGQENLCPNARFTGYQIDGGYADRTVADARYVFRIPDRYSDTDA